MAKSGNTGTETNNSLHESHVFQQARFLFPDGITVSREAKLEDRLSRTKMFCSEWMQNFNGNIFSAWFTHAGIALYIDILKYDAGWHAYSIQNRGAFASLQNMELALQAYILYKNNIELSSFTILYVDKLNLRVFLLENISTAHI